MFMMFVVVLPPKMNEKNKLIKKNILATKTKKHEL